ncbi:MAG TPA: AAA family ATPase [Bacillus sp. (in: firmicutes)]|nr:AAA family ATPase [Bacillus sp. (in: firmicutes)]
MTRKIYLISGPAGVGKSTTSKVLAEHLHRSAYISGDVISLMPVAGYEKPWESEKAKDLVWTNIISLTDNFLSDDRDVVVDWVMFWEDIKKYTLSWIKQGIEVRHVILWADEETHLNRDVNRPVEMQMGERVIILRNEFLQSGAPPRFFFDNTSVTPEDAIHRIRTEQQFLISKLDLI